MNDTVQPPPMQVSLIDWRPFKKNSLLGFASVRLGALLVRDLTVHASNGRRWVGLPAKPRLSAGGEVMKGDNGKALYTPVIEWASRDTADRFSNAVIAAIEREHPGAADA